MTFNDDDFEIVGSDTEAKPQLEFNDDDFEIVAEPARATPQPKAPAPAPKPQRPDMDPISTVQGWGAGITSGVRTKSYNKRVGGKTNSKHLTSDAMDLTLGNSGMSWKELHQKAKQIAAQWPGGTAIFEGDHVHLQLPGWGGAPIAAGSNAELDLEIVEDAPAPAQTNEAAPAPNSTNRMDGRNVADYSDLTGEREQRSVADKGATYRTETDALAEGTLNNLIRRGLPYEKALELFNAKHPQHNGFDKASYVEAVKWAKAHPNSKVNLAAAPRYVPLSNSGQTANDFAQSAPGALIGNFANAATAGAPVLLAGQEGNDWERQSFENHPVASWTGAIGGGITGAVAGGAVAKSVLPAVNPVAVQAGVDVAMGAGYGAATAGPGNRLQGAALGGSLALGAELGLRGIAKGLAPKAGYNAGRAYADDLAGAATQAAPVENNVSNAMAMNMDRDPEIILDPTTGQPVSGGAPDLPLGMPRNVRSPDDTTAAVLATDPADFIPNGTSAANQEGKVANINLNNIESVDDISRALKATEDALPMDAARRGKISHEETKALADDLGTSADDLLGRRQGQALNAEQALAARNILAKSTEELTALARVAKDNGGIEDLAAFQRALVRHAAIQEQVSGATAEAGRALSAFRITASSDAVKGQVLRAVVEGNEQNLAKIAQNILDAADNPSLFNRYAREAWKPTTSDKLVELYYAMMLSGPQTHAANIVGNTLTTITQPIEQALAAGLGAVRGGVGKVIGKDVDRVLFSEVGARSFGLLQGAKDGAEAVARFLRTGETSDSVSKVEAARQGAISGTKGKVIRTPLAALTAEDEFFKSIGRRMELNALAVKKARGEGLRGDAAKQRIAELLQNPTPKMVEQSMEYARYLTFQKQLGGLGTSVMKTVNNHPWLKLFVPFIRTPANLFKYAGERSPLALAMPSVWKGLRAGGAKRDVAVARMMFGTGLAMATYELAIEGMITGNGPADPNEKRLLQAKGWQPFSLKVGDSYYSYQRLDPFSTIVGTVADMAEKKSGMTDVQKEKEIALLIGGFVANLENKSFLTGVSDLFSAVTAAGRGQPEEAIRVMQQRAAGVLVPAIVGQTASTLDPVQRTTGEDSFTGGLVDAIQNKIPGLSDNNAPSRDIMGDPRATKDALGPNVASPIRKSAYEADAEVQAILDSDARLGRLQRRIKGTKLNDKQWDDYQSLAGKLLRQYIREEVQAPDWASLSKEDRADLINEAKKDARADARYDLKLEFEDNDDEE